MGMPQEYKYSSNKRISDNEYEVIDKFLDQYRNENVIIADEHRFDYTIVPFEGERVAFRVNEPHWKSMNFQRRIMHEGKPYVVKLGLWSINPKEKDPKCLTIYEFEVNTSGRHHSITLSTDDHFKKKIMYNIIDIFDENKIISPEAAYCNRMYTNKTLQKFIKKHEWGKINEGITEKPDLANALFIIGESKKDPQNYNADFGTILYQLIAYRNAHQIELNQKELLELDKLILELRDTELLKVHLRDDITISKTYPSGSILLDGYYHGGQMRISEQYNVDNGELEKEEKTLNKVLKQF